MPFTEAIAKPSFPDHTAQLALIFLDTSVDQSCLDLNQRRALCISMNLPFTMSINQAASALAAFQPTFVSSYHYQRHEGGTQSPSQLASLVRAATTVNLHNWYDEFWLWTPQTVVMSGASNAFAEPEPS